MFMSEAERRYRNDVTFAQCVDWMRKVIRELRLSPKVIRELRLSPSEMREALMVAVYCEEIENPVPLIIRVQNFARELTYDCVECSAHKTKNPATKFERGLPVCDEHG